MTEINSPGVEERIAEARSIAARGKPKEGWGDYTPGPWYQEWTSIVPRKRSRWATLLPIRKIAEVYGRDGDARLISKAYLIPRLEEAVAEMRTELSLVPAEDLTDEQVTGMIRMVDAAGTLLEELRSS